MTHHTHAHIFPPDGTFAAAVVDPEPEPEPLTGTWYFVNSSSSTIPTPDDGAWTTTTNLNDGSEGDQTTFEGADVGTFAAAFYVYGMIVFSETITLDRVAIEVEHQGTCSADLYIAGATLTSWSHHTDFAIPAVAANVFRQLEADRLSDPDVAAIGFRLGVTGGGLENAAMVRIYDLRADGV
jgi:hypothetical protein